MKKLLIAASAMVSALALTAVEYAAVSFETTGPDKYADGTNALEGECYALVWTADGVFEGFKVDGACIDNNDEVVAVMPWATKDSAFPATVLNVGSDTKYFENGTFALYLLDTRKYVDGAAKVSGVDAAGKLVFVNASSEIEGAVTVARGGASAPESKVAASGAVGAAVGSEVDGVKAPTIKGFDFVKLNGADYVKLTVADTDNRLNYAIKGGDTVAVDGATGTDVKTGVGGDKTITLLYPKAEGANFFKVIRK